MSWPHAVQIRGLGSINQVRGFDLSVSEVLVTRDSESARLRLLPGE